MKRLLLGLLAFVLAGLVSITAAAVSREDGTAMTAEQDGLLYLYDELGEAKAASAYVNGYTFEVRPDQTLYLPLGTLAQEDWARLWLADSKPPVLSESAQATAADLTEPDLFRLHTDKEGPAAKLVRVTQYPERTLPPALDGARCGWLKLEIGPSQTLEEQKVRLDMTFTAREDDNNWQRGDYATLSVTLWVSNAVEHGGDIEQEAGESFLFDPQDNDWNLITWDGVATLNFQADEHPEKFYVKLSTKVDEQIDRQYAQPVNAELFFWDFSGSPAIPAVSRATLVLFNPWAGRTNPQDCHIYAKDSDGTLTEITSRFSYLTVDEEGNDVNGWQTRTRTLGCYILSDCELELSSQESAQEQMQEEEQEVTAVQEKQPIEKPNPLTGR